MGTRTGWIAGAIAFALGCGCAHAVDLKEVERELNGDGAVGWIHGSVNQHGTYVFTYRNPKDFFDYALMSLIPADGAAAKALEALNRHDKVRVKGRFLSNPSPQKHIKAASIEIVKKYEGPATAGAYEYAAEIPKDLIGQTSAHFLVHAVGGDGHILVVEYKDAVLPVYVRDATLAQGLFRNDLVKLEFKIRIRPNQPTHLALDEKAEKPVILVESIRAKHGKPAEMEGALILFPKSPEIIFNVFALQEDMPHGLGRQYTLVNFENPEAFKKIREKLQAAWDRHPNAYVNGRNKLVSTSIRVKAKGVFNEVDANQANPQILLKDADSIEILER